jgi:3'(2'), 5'-bisphosphate nucleotidase
MSSLETLMPAVVAIARQAGRTILELASTRARRKDDGSPVTAADEAADALIRSELSRLEPWAIVSEEAPVLSGPAQRFWLVDPLDGTKEFIAGRPEYTVNIAIIEDGRPSMGVVHAPAMRRTWWGIVGVAAWTSVNDGAAAAIGVSRHEAGPWRVVASRSHGDAETEAFIDRLGDSVRVPMGSSLKFCAVAEGTADLYPRFGPTSLWDTGAAHAVVEAAGGRVLARDGRPLAYDPTRILNPSFLCVGEVELARVPFPWQPHAESRR